MPQMTQKRPTLLTDMEISEISLCGAPASPGSDVALFKADLLRGAAFGRGLVLFDGNDVGKTAYEVAVDEADGVLAKALSDGSPLPNDDGSLEMAVYNLAVSLASVDPDAADAEGQFQKQASAFGEWIAEWASVEKKGQSMANMTKTKADPEGTGKVVHAQHVDKTVDAGKTMADGTIVSKADDPAGGGTVLKDGEIVISKEGLSGIIKDAVAAATADLRGTIAKMNEEAIAKERIAKAKVLADGVANVTAEQVETVLKALGDDTAAVAAYEASLNAARSVTKAATKEIGHTGASGAGAGQSDIEKAVDAYIAKDGAKISREEATLKVLEENPELYAQYRRDRLRLGGEE